VRPIRENITGELLGEETILAKLMGQGKLLAFQIFCSILKDYDFEVSSVICKNGSISKEFLGI